MKYYIGIDIGTSATKSVVFNNKGEVKASFSSEYELLCKKTSYAEQRPIDWYNAVIKTLKEIGKLPFKNDILGIGLSGQMHGLVLFDKNDQVLRDSIIWCDNRSHAEAKMISKLGNDKVKAITGNYPMIAFTLAKLLWVKNNEPDIFEKVAKVMLPKDYIRYMLTKEFKTEYSDASGMQILDIRNNCYSKEILDAFSLKEEMFPKLIESNEISGYLTKEVSQLTNLNGIFVVGGAGDQAAGAIGNGIVTSDDICITLGSSGVVFSVLDKYELSRAQTFRHAVKDTYHTMGVTNGCGISLKWFKEEFCIEEVDYSLKENMDPYDYLMSRASNIEAGADDLFYLPYLMGERTPYLNPNATGLFLGIKKTTTKDHFLRAIIEGISYSMLDCYNLNNKEYKNVYLSGGGAKSTLWQEIIASMLNRDVKRINQDEGPALGAAILAMVAGNEYKDIKDACKSIISLKSIVKPIPKWRDIYQKRYNIYQDLYLTNKEIYEKINRLKGE